jgi:hypothetical protein
MKVNRYLLGAMVAAVIGLTAHVEAESLFIENPGFEDEWMPDGNYFIGAPKGWEATGGLGGVFNPTDYHFVDQAPAGRNIAWSHGASFSQVLDDVLTVNTSYVLSIEVGARLDIGISNYFVELWAGDSLLATAAPVLPESGRFSTVNVTYDALVGDPDAGSALMIRFGSFGSTTNFDIVRLTATAIPTPGSLALLAFAAVIVRPGRRR